MGGLDLDLLDSIISYQLDLNRLDAGVRQQVIDVLVRMQRELVTKLANEDLTAYGKQRTASLLKECDEILYRYYTIAQGALDLTLQGVGGVTAAQTASALSVAVTVQAHLPTENYIKTLVSNVLVQGAPSAGWWSKQSLDTSFKFANEVRQGLAQSETNSQIIARIVGKSGNPGIMDIAKRNAAALVQSSVQAVANASRLETFRKNSDVITALQQLSTLDSHTSLTCISYSGMKWTVDGKPLDGALPFNGGPPRHWNCRSVLVPITKLSAFMPKGARASEGGQVPSSTTFDDWLSRRTTAQQDEQLGAGRAQMWRDKKITLAQLIDGKGRELTLSQLQAKYK